MSIGRHGHRRSLLRLTLLSLAIAQSLTTVAAEDTFDDSAQSSTVTYPASYFAEFAPLTANDMVTRIPGAEQLLRNRGGGRRGLGSGENEILINGQRMTGKSVSARDQLARIPADQVEYIEIIRGSSESLDVRNAGETLNIVLVAGRAQRSLNTELNVVRLQDHSLTPGGKFAVTGQSGRLNYLVGGDVEVDSSREIRREVSTFPDGSLNDLTYEEEVRDQIEYRVSSALSYQLDRDLLQFNALYSFRAPPTDTIRAFDSYRGPEVVSRYEREARRFDRYTWEMGGDWEHNRDNGDTFRMLFIVNDTEGSGDRERFRVQGETEEKTYFLYTLGRDRERIARSSYTLTPLPGHGLEVGLEAAQTIRDNDLRLGLAGSGTPSASVGGLVPVNVPNATSQVEEVRVEGFAIHNWQLNDRMSLESTLVLEDSTISQSGDVNNSRDFSFWRPKVDYRFNLTSALQFRASLERDISQLSFADFSATIDNSDLDKDTESGNPEIAQEKTWVYSLNMDYRLPSNSGAVSAGLFYRDIEDVIDRVDVSTATSLLSARGNIGDGKRYGVNLNASVRLGFLGLPNALLTTGLGLSDSSVTDPFLGTERRLRNNGRGFGSLGFRHDVPTLNLNYGFNLGNPINGGSGRAQVDIDDIEIERNETNLNMFVEKVAFGTTTLRLDARNVLDSRSCFLRLRYAGATADGLLEEIEDSCTASGPQMTLTVRRTF